MDNDLYRQFKVSSEAGRKAEAKALLLRFLESFTSQEERRAWTYPFLERGEYGHRIRHELYAEVIFPVLLADYQRREPRSLYWLAKTASNLYTASALHAQIDMRGEKALLIELYALSPDEEVRQLLLRSYLHGFDFCQHEWPAAILYGMDGATSDECEALLEEIAFARTLDDGSHSAYFAAFEERIQQYRERVLFDRLDSPADAYLPGMRL